MRTAKLFLLSATFLVLSTIIIQAQNKIKRNSNDQVLISLVNQMREAQTNFDATTLDKIYASDYIEVSPIGEVDLRDEAVGFYKSENNPNRNKMKMVATADEFSIRTYRDFAVVISRFTFTQAGSEPAGRPPVSFRATIICRKEKGTWKIGSVQATGIMPSRTRPVK